MISICRASAGSGKTHKLTGEYLKLLFGGSGDISAYKHIVAVTFTNKATDEMKNRILDELYILSSPNGASDYLLEIMELGRFASIRDTKLREESVRRCARAILVEILNDYSLFNISTIDRFFQQTLRAFARELGQYTSYNVELDKEAVLNESIDQMMDSLEDNPDLLKWLILLSINAIDEGDKWDSTSRLKQLGKELFSEDFKIKSRKHKDKLRDKPSIDTYRKRLLEIVGTYQSDMVALAKEGLKLISDAGLDPGSFAGGSNSSFFYLQKIASYNFSYPSDTFLNLNSNVEKWYVKSTKPSVRDTIISLYENGLGRVISEIVSNLERYDDYNSANLILKDLLTLGLLYDIYANVESYCKSKNLVLLSETTDFLNSIIDGSDTPFIYEKLGGHIDHYMLDEFQDTSRMQWDNFKPLIKDSLANGFSNLIVGDVKQSIYRWRGSDWKLLNQIVNKDFDRKLVKEQSLSDNWRSGRNIVEFNNQFFAEAGRILQGIYNSDSSRDRETMISDIYSSISQTIPQKSKAPSGHVRVTFLDSSAAGVPYQEDLLGRLPSVLDELVDSGYTLKDIALLVRRNTEGAILANFLLQRGYNVISEDSLLISSSKAVRSVVTLLKLMSDPQDKMASLLLDGDSPHLKEHTLYNICEEAFRQLQDSFPGEETFVCAFLDSVSDYVSKNGSDIKGFVKWWDECGKTHSVSAPEGENALQIMTIHKAKGLGFKVVILPFFHESLIPKKSKILWCEPHKAPFDALPLLPIHFSSAMNRSIFCEDYLDERLYYLVDALNTTYVSFTRAKEELIIFSPKPKPTSKGIVKNKSISDILFNCYSSSLDTSNVLNIGEMSLKERQNASSVSEILPYRGEFFSVPIGERLKLHLSASDFFLKDNMRSKGVVMHDILSSVSVSGDLEHAISAAISDGQVSSAEYQYLHDTLTALISSVSHLHWFDGSYNHFNELSILTPDGEEYRPDRVMTASGKTIVVDYKFGALKSHSYNLQVKRYMDLLSSMGYSDISGYIWYCHQGIIEEVRL